jgi:hypothetical protein
LFQTSFLPDLTQVYLVLETVWVIPALVQLAPGFAAGAALALIGAAIRSDTERTVTRTLRMDTPGSIYEHQHRPANSKA